MKRYSPKAEDIGITPVAMGKWAEVGDIILMLGVSKTESLLKLDDFVIDEIRCVEGITETETIPCYEYYDISSKETTSTLTSCIMIDVEPGMDRQVFQKLCGLRKKHGVTPRNAAIIIHSREFDQMVTLDAVTEVAIYKYVEEEIRTIEGVWDTDVNTVYEQINFRQE